MASYLDKAGLSSVWSKMKDKMYPVGSIYISTDSTSPASIYGGTWEQLKDRFLVGAGNSYAVNDTGGEANHTLTVSEMPVHTVMVFKSNNSSADVSHSYWGGGTVPAGQATATSVYDYNVSYNGQTISNPKAITNIPPYLSVYIWKRTA